MTNRQEGVYTLNLINGEATVLISDISSLQREDPFRLMDNYIRGSGTATIKGLSGVIPVRINPAHIVSYSFSREG